MIKMWVFFWFCASKKFDLNRKSHLRIGCRFIMVLTLRLEHHRNDLLWIWTPDHLIFGCHQWIVQPNICAVNIVDFIGKKREKKDTKMVFIMWISVFFTEAINKYNASASSTQEPAPGDRTFKLQYAVGALTGVVSIDTISVRPRINQFHFNLKLPKKNSTFNFCKFIDWKMVN